MRRFWPVLFLALVPFIALWKPIFKGEAIGAFDQVGMSAPWLQNSEKPWDVLQADSVLQFYPWRDLVFQSWSKGHVPFWNPYQFGGTPLLANSQSGGFYPLHILVGVLNIPTTVGMTFLAWFHLFWAGLGIYLLTRQVGGSVAGGLFAGVSLSLSAFFLAWTALPSVITTCSWIPWLLASIYAMFYGLNGYKPWLAALGVSVSTGMMILGGHLQFVAYGMMAAVFVTLWLLISGISQRRYEHDFGQLGAFSASGVTLLAILAGICLAGPQLSPVLKFSEYSHRQNKPSAEGYQAYRHGGIGTMELTGLAFPNALGNPREFLPGGAEQRINSYWPSLTKQGANFAESALSPGPLVLALLACLSLSALGRRQAWCFVAIALIALLLAIGSQLNWPLYNWVPGWSSTGSPGRIAVLFLMSLCVLGGLAASEMLEDPKFNGKKIAVSGLILLALLALTLVPQPTSELPGLDSSTLQTIVQNIRQTETPSILIAALITIIALFGGYKMKDAGGWLLPLAALFVTPILFATSIIPTSREPLQAVIAPEKPESRIAMINDQWELAVPIKATLPPNTASFMRIRDIGGYDSLIHKDTVAMLQDIDLGQDPAPPTNGNMMFVKPQFNAEKLMDAGVTEVWSQKQLNNAGQFIKFEKGLYRYSLPGRGIAYTEKGSASILSENTQSMSVIVLGPGTLTVKSRWLPGWKATIDGKDVEMKEGRWRELEVGPGNQTVEFSYVPEGYERGLGAFVLGLVLTVFCVAAANRGQ